MDFLMEEKTVFSSPLNFDKFLSVALTYPNTYHLGMSNLGFQTVYSQLNSRKDVGCERAFYPTFKTLETKRSINRFDCICLSIPFELDFPNFLSMLHKINIPLLSSDRSERAPLIIIGGAFSTINPEVMAEFADIMIIGEGEELIHELFDHIHDWKAFSMPKIKLFDELKQIPGIYIPSIDQQNIERRVIENLSGLQTYSSIISPDAHFSNTFLVEVNRGCPYGCKFCAVSKICSPFREYSFDDVWQAIQLGSLITKKIGLVGSAIGDVSYFDDLLSRLATGGYEVGLSSLRTNKISLQTTNFLLQCGIKTLTIAPEAGSEKMRKFIRKNLTEDQILNAANVIAQSKIKNVKLYFIVGLPSETEDDVLAIINLSKKILKITNANISLSINPFIPKPHTPLQDCPMEGSQSLKKKYQLIKKGLKSERKIKLHFESIRLAKIQGLLSQGDRKLATLLISKAMTDMNWNDCLRKTQIDLNPYIYQK